MVDDRIAIVSLSLLICLKLSLSCILVHVLHYPLSLFRTCGVFFLLSYEVLKI